LGCDRQESSKDLEEQDANEVESVCLASSAQQVANRGCIEKNKLEGQ